MASIRKRTPWRLVLEDVSRSKIYSTRKQAEAENDAFYAQGLMGLRVEPVPGGSYEVRIRNKLAPDLVKTFRRLADADAWAKAREGEIAKRQFVNYGEADRNSLGDLFARYDRERLDGWSLEDADKSRIGKLRSHTIALLRMSVLQSCDLSAYRDERKELVKGATVTKELELICRVISIARAEWGVHMAVNPASGRLVPRPKKEPGDERDRRLADSHLVVAPAKPPRPQNPQRAGPCSPNRVARTKKGPFENEPETDRLLKLRSPHACGGRSALAPSRSRHRTSFLRRDGRGTPLRGSARLASAYRSPSY